MAGLDVSGYRTTPAFASPTLPGAVIDREAVMIEWTDRNTANATFEGTARAAAVCLQHRPLVGNRRHRPGGGRTTAIRCGKGRGP